MLKNAFVLGVLVASAGFLLACQEAAQRPTARAKVRADSGSNFANDASAPGSDSGFSLIDQGVGQDSGAFVTSDSGVWPDAAAPDASPFIGDRDQDGLPDAEDPEPGNFNAILYSDDFTEIGPDWLFTSVSMKIDPSAEQLRVTQVEPFIREGWIGPRPAWGDLYLRTHVRITGLGNSNMTGSGQVGLMGHVNQLTPDRYLVCGVNLKTNTVFISEHNGGTAEGRVLAEEPISIQLNEWFVLGFDMKIGDLRCTAGVVSVRAVSNLYFAGAIGFRSFDSSFDAENVQVYIR